jgi:endonuclease/exonuclease/phosphatase family metal-dependent hydrolase
MGPVARVVVGVVVVSVLASACGDGAEQPAADERVVDETGIPASETDAATGESDAATSEAGAEPIEATPATIRFVSQNLLHGFGCPAESDRCRLDARVALFTSQLGAAGCPEMVSIQEANAVTVAAIESHPAPGCDYAVVWDGDEGLDREVVLTTLDVIDHRRLRLAGRFRSAFLVRVVSAAGVVDFVSAHLASSDNRECDAQICPPPCEIDDQVRACQARQVLEWAASVALHSSITVLAGDMNAEADQPPIELILGAGYVDSHVAAGQAECEEASGLNCTAGRASTSLVDMIDPSSSQRRRIDYLFFDPGSTECAVGDGTGMFNAEPASGDLAYPSDHTGVVLVLECEPAGGTDDAVVPTLPDEPEPVDEPASGAADPATEAAIAGAYETFFDGAIADLDLRLAQVENGDRFEEVFSAQVEAAGAFATETSARVESVILTSEATADVVYTILVLGSAVFDHVDGDAVRIDGRWLVGQETFCDLARQDPSNVPAECA